MDPLRPVPFPRRRRPLFQAQDRVRAGTVPRGANTSVELPGREPLAAGSVALAQSSALPELLPH
jgi:hypothetical protein